MSHQRQTWNITISGTMDHEKVAAMVIGLDNSGFRTGICLSGVFAYQDNTTTIQHWCNKAAADATAARLIQDGHDARVCDNLPG